MYYKSTIVKKPTNMNKYKQNYELVAEAESLLSRAFMKAKDEEVRQLVGEAGTKLLEFLNRENMNEVECTGTYGLWVRAEDAERVVDYLSDFSPNHPFKI